MNKGRDNEAGGNGLSSRNVAKKQVRSLIGQGNEAAAMCEEGEERWVADENAEVGNVTDGRQIDSLIEIKVSGEQEQEQEKSEKRGVLAGFVVQKTTGCYARCVIRFVVWWC